MSIHYHRFCMRSIPAIDIYILLLVRFYILDAYKAFDQLTACIEATPPEVPSQESHDTRAAFVDKLAAKHSVDKQVHIGNISLTQIVDTVRAQSLRVYKTTGAEAYKTRGMSVRRVVRTGTTTLSDVVSRIAVRSSSTAQAAIRFNSCNELEFHMVNSLGSCGTNAGENKHAVGQWRLVRSS